MELELVQQAIGRTPPVVSRGAPGPSEAESAVQPPDEAAACAPWLMPVTYHAVDIDEPPDKPRFDCRKVRMRLTVMGAGDAVLCATEGQKALNRVCAERLVYEAIAQGGILSREDLAFLLGTSLGSVADILAGFDEQGQTLPCRGENGV